MGAFSVGEQLCHRLIEEVVLAVEVDPDLLKTQHADMCPIEPSLLQALEQAPVPPEAEQSESIGFLLAWLLMLAHFDRAVSHMRSPGVSTTTMH